MARFARHQQQADSRPGATKIFGEAPKPDKWVVKDTSVNVATAFQLAASTEAEMSAGAAGFSNPNAAWASTSRTTAIPRSSSVEYESNASALGRRLAPPPNKLGRGPSSSTTGRAKPPSRNGSSYLTVPDSENDEERLNSRAKSPIGNIVDAAKNILGPAIFYVRAQSREPTDQAGDKTHTSQDSYSYEQEDRDYQAAKQKQRRNRISTDNKAYKPPVEEDNESEFSDDEKGRKRRKKVKKGPLGGPLHTLPTVGPEKRRKKRSGKGNNSFGDEVEGSEEEYEEEEEVSHIFPCIRSASQFGQISLRASVKPPSTSHRSLDLPNYSLEDSTSMDTSQQGLQSIQEVEEEILEPPIVQRQSSQRARSRTPAPRPPAAPFSIGGLLGKVVRNLFVFMAWSLSTALYFMGTVFGTLYDTLVQRPTRWLKKASGSSGFLIKYVTSALVLVAAWYFVSKMPLSSYIPSFRSSRPVYTPPEAPAADIEAIASRLYGIEAAVVRLTTDVERHDSAADKFAKNYNDLHKQLNSFETRLSQETKKVQDIGARDVASVLRSISNFKTELDILQSDLANQKRQQQQHRPSGDAADEEARAKLRLLEDRVGSVEGSVKDALEAVKKGSIIAPAIPAGNAWWTKAGAKDKAGIQIKTADGQDITALISQLVESAVLLQSKDGGVAKPDFAMYSAGARVIPSLTSPTLEVRPHGFTAQIAGLLTGSGYSTGRPPTNALYHETHDGYCWPFAGTQGQLGVSLAAPVHVEYITIDHVAKELALNYRSAPREMEVWGLVEGQDNVEKLQRWREERKARRDAGEVPGADDYDEESIAYPPTLPTQPQYLRIANFTYNVDAENNVQTFPVHPEIKHLGIDFGIVVLRVLSNWGRNELTCLYRFRVHGTKLSDDMPIVSHADGDDF